MTLYKNKYRIESNRNQRHDYNGEFGAKYFVTICTQNMRHYFGEIYNKSMHLSKIGIFLDELIQNIGQYYDYAQIPNYVIMPHHVHFILKIDWHKSNLVDEDKNPMKNKTIGTVIRGLKARVTRFANENGLLFQWERNYNDEIIWKNDDLQNVIGYINDNVKNWKE